MVDGQRALQGTFNGKHLEKPLLLGDARRSYAMLGDATRGMVA